MATITKSGIKRVGPSKAGQGLTLSTALLWGMLVVFPISLLLVLLAGNDVNLKYSQRIFYYHLPANIFCFVAFGVYFVGGIGYWRTRKRIWDIVMIAGLELGLLFALIGTATGSIWAGYAWNTFWTWDPRLTTMAILLVWYVSGLMLRAAVDEPSRKAALTAVFGIIGFVNVPLVYFSTRWFPAGLHPVIFATDGKGKETSVGLEGGLMQAALVVCMIAVGMLFTYLLLQRIKLGKIQDEVAALSYARALQENEE